MSSGLKLFRDPGESPGFDGRRSIWALFRTIEVLHASLISDDIVGLTPRMSKYASTSVDVAHAWDMPRLL